MGRRSPGALRGRSLYRGQTERNEQPGAVYLKRIREHFRRCAWLNPMEKGVWSAPSIRLIREIFPMYALTVQGVEELAKDLSKG